MKHLIWPLLLILTACSSQTGGRYHIANDEAPDSAPDLSQLEPLKPRFEPQSRGGNRDYHVLGKNYQVLETAKGYSEQGIASWYGAKFHGHLTSNGETYDMFGLSGAHKSLPLPTYVQVTNLANGKQLVVRVNDRGPFHPGRIIDLSYAAASKLGVLATGTAPVKVEAYHFDGPNARALLPSQQTGTYIQLVASQNRQALVELTPRLTEYETGHRITNVNGLHKLQLGPIVDPQLVGTLLKQLQQSGFPQAFPISPVLLSH